MISFTDSSDSDPEVLYSNSESSFDFKSFGNEFFSPRLLSSLLLLLNSITTLISELFSFLFSSLSSETSFHISASYFLK